MQQLVNARAAQAASAQNTSTAILEFPEVYPGNIRRDDVLDARTEAIIGCYADKLVASGAFREYERDDIRQELRLRLLRKTANFNPARSDRYSYAGLVIANGYKNMLKIRDRELKRQGGFLSLQDIPEGSDEPLENAISGDDYEAMMGRRTIPSTRQRDYDEARAEFLNSLSEEDRRIWDALVACDCNADKASRLIGLSARTVLRHLNGSIRQAAEVAGLGEFFGGAR